MNTKWSAALGIIAAVVVIGTPYAQVQKVDAEKMLAERFGFSAAEIGQARAGQAVTKLLPSKEAIEVGVGGAVRVPGTPDRLVYWLKDIAGFRKAAELGLSKKLSSPPQIGDFADLSLSDDELAALKACRPGNCDLRLGDKAIARFQADVDWSSPDAARRASELTRQLMLGHAQAYLRGGDEALGTAHNEKTPRLTADEFRYLLYQSTALYELAPAFANYLDKFPAASLPGAEQFLYWAKGGGGPEASITLHQLVIYTAPGGAVFVADKQIYASRYTDALLVVISLASTSDGAGYYAMVGARARSRMLDGMAARLLRGRVQKATIETARMYLDWIQQSLASAR
ncbi:MAG: hypothetical protein NTY02_17450 [Acidobacteria bacterium]|nr:hypothetical protein [Acidobacteriota bacterium]